MLVRSQRQPLHSGNTAPEVGPGAYNSTQEITNPKTRFGNAPFGSTTVKLTNFSSDTPGPGSYNDASVDGLSGARNTAKHNTAGISFSSRSTRFQHSGSAAPGPGSYNPQLLPNHVKNANVMGFTSSRDGIGSVSSPTTNGGIHGRSMSSPPVTSSGSSNHVNWVKVATAPSIPAGAQTYGYEEGPGGALVQQPSPISGSGLGHQGTTRDLAGPGEYDPKFRLVQKTAHVPSFGLSQGKRSDPVPRDSLHKPGPGTYNLENRKSDGLKLASAGSCFNSRTERIFVPNSDQPGPGEYHSDALARSSFKDVKHHLAAQPESFHGFGSSAADPRWRAENGVPGPGHYAGGSLDAPSIQIKNKAMKNAVFSSTCDRFTDKHQAMPGPGSYEWADMNSLRTKLAKIQPGRFGGFGSTASRFAKTQQANETSDQPETSAAPSALTSGSGSYRSGGGGGTSSFRPPATVTRRPSPPSQNKEQEPLTWTDTRVLPDMWNKKSFSSKPSMFSSGPRLLSHESAVPGPGTYKTNVDELNRGGARFGGESRFNSSNGSKKSRLGSRGNNNGNNDGPGPGSYFEPRSWNKQSFNVTFT